MTVRRHLMQLKGGARWTITPARENVSFEKVDPWLGYWASRQTLDYAMEALGYQGEEGDPRPDAQTCALLMLVTPAATLPCATVRRRSVYATDTFSDGQTSADKAGP